MDRFIERFDITNFGRLISDATNKIFISIPNVHGELAKELLEAKQRISNIKIVVDCSEDSFRNGYGRADSIECLEAAGIEIFESQKNRVSFIICDEKGYFIFPESRIFVHGDVGNNAVKMDPISQLHLISYFFSSENQTEVIVVAINMFRLDFCNEVMHLDGDDPFSFAPSLSAWSFQGVTDG